MFEAGKTYKTRDGRDFLVYATDGTHPYPIRGAIKHGNNSWISATRTRYGTTCEGETSGSDIVLGPPSQCTTRPWTRADVPWPRPEFRRIASETGSSMTVHWICDDGVGFSGCGFVSWINLSTDWQYSVDGGKTWIACEVVE